MTPRRVREARARAALPPAVITAAGSLTTEEAAVILARWRRISRYPAIVVPDRFTVTVHAAPKTQRLRRPTRFIGV